MYSHMVDQCLQPTIKQLHATITSILVLAAPTVLDLFLLTATMIKTFRIAVVSESHPSSPIVRVVLDSFCRWFQVEISQMRALLRDELMYVKQRT
jgi:hypothetical protein